MQAIFTSKRLSGMAVRLVAIILLLAMGAPYGHALILQHAHEECGMEMCKRSGKCCCRRSIPGRPQLRELMPCDSGPSTAAGVAGPQAALTPTIGTVAAVLAVTDPDSPPRAGTPSAASLPEQFQRPPPRRV